MTRPNRDNVEEFKTREQTALFTHLMIWAELSPSITCDGAVAGWHLYWIKTTVVCRGMYVCSTGPDFPATTTSGNISINKQWKYIIMSTIAIPVRIYIHTKTGPQCHLNALIVTALVVTAWTCTWAKEAAIRIVCAAIWEFYQKIPITFRIIHVLASRLIGTVHVTVPWRTFLSTIFPITTNFDINTGAAILPASSTPRAAVQPHGRLDEGGCNKETVGCMEYFHVDVVNLPLELAWSYQEIVGTWESLTWGTGSKEYRWWVVDCSSSRCWRPLLRGVIPMIRIHPILVVSPVRNRSFGHVGHRGMRRGCLYSMEEFSVCDDSTPISSEAVIGCHIGDVLRILPTDN